MGRYCTEASAPSTPGVSVIIPAYNQPLMLGEALASVQAQTVSPVEIVVIDDCSENPLELTTPYSPELPLRFVRHRENRGPAASVVHGIGEARCALIAMLNHDDAWEPAFLERLTHALDKHPEACLAFCDHGIMRADGRHDERRSDAQSARYARARLDGGLLAGAALHRIAILEKAIAGSSFALARRDALDLALIGAGGDTWDYALAVGACRTGRPAIYVAERLGWYRVSPTMLSATHANPHKQIELARAQTMILIVILRSRELRSVHRAIRRRLAGAMSRSLGVALRTGDPRNLARVATRVLAGAGDARRITVSREPMRSDHPPQAVQGHAGSRL
jgi:glycosyltransferase involved in cell wall biosynthesis